MDRVGCLWRFRSSGMWHSSFGSHLPRFRSVVVPSYSVPSSAVTSWHCTWRHHYPSKRPELFTQRQFVTCQKNESSATPLWEPKLLQGAMCLIQLSDGWKYFCTVVSFDMVPLYRVTWYRCVDWYGTVVSIDMVPLCRLTWYRCVDWHGTVVSIDMVPLCRLTWYRCVDWHGTVVSIDMVPLYRVTWYRCVDWYGTVFSQLFKCLVSFVQLWCVGSIRQLNCRLILFLVQPDAQPRKIFSVYYSLCIIPFLCFYAQNVLCIRHAYWMKQWVVLSDLQ